ncbi:hypothetical protein LEP1GSC059_1594 [Leptospira noguchii serovar Panama str. CZ214]|uniref:Uncharacterized protein n=1 Tax=Leptospira noguchii serovar Panama str. CZ214 TaxID=1001595 RepID=T0FIR2_9LEPT|nr:hypothetical protein LEP1GSC059_1594 [Leptospira noguchii serovar Panama str. CZ214]
MPIQFQTKIFTFKRNISIYNFQKIRSLEFTFSLSYKQHNRLRVKHPK